MDNLRRDINYKVLRYIRPHHTVLSIGCGSGKLESEIKRAGASVYGIDIDEDAVKAARNVVDQAAALDIEKAGALPFPGISFDAILFIDVLEHVCNPGAILKMVTPRLKPGGCIIVSIPNIGNWSVRFPLLFGRFEYTAHGILDRTHLRFYTLKAVRELIGSSGFRICRVDYTTNLLNTLYGRISSGAPRTYPSALSDSKGRVSPVPKYPLRGFARSALEKIDSSLGKLAQGLFAFQFIIIAKPGSSDDTKG